MSSSRVVAGTVGRWSRTVVRSTAMSVVFITTAAWAWRANVGDTGRASTDIARSIGSGMCRVRGGREGGWGDEVVGVPPGPKHRGRAVAGEFAADDHHPGLQIGGRADD